MKPAMIWIDDGKNKLTSIQFNDPMTGEILEIKSPL